jgi:hypothetical protein
MPSRKNRDVKLILIGFLIAACFLGLLIFDYLRPASGALVNRKPIGFAEFVKQDVRRRIDGEINWGELTELGLVYWGDTIFVGPKSSVTIKLDSGQVLKLKPNTLIVLAFYQQQPEIQMRFGRLAAELNGRQLMIHSDKGLNEASGKGTLETEVNGLSSLKVHGVEGILTLKKGDTTVSLTEGQTFILGEAIQVEEVKSTVLPCQFVVPNTQEANIDWVEGSKVQLQWVANAEACGRFEVLIYESENQEEPSQKIEVGETKLEILPESVTPFYWQVLGRDSSGQVVGSSLRQKINLVGSTPTPTPTPAPSVTPGPEKITLPPVLKGPVVQNVPDILVEREFNGQRTKKVSIDVSWSEIKGIERYYLEISASADFEPSLVLPVQGNTIKVEIEQPQKYFVRVFGIEKKSGRKSSPSKSREFDYNLLDPIKTPTDCLPKEGTTFAFEDQKPMVLAWSKGEGDVEFELEIAKDSMFKAVLLKLQGHGNSYLITEKNLGGRYYWRVRYFKKTTGQRSSWSNTHTFSIVKLLYDEPPE